MGNELWAIEGKATEYADPAAKRKLFELAHNRYDARQIAKAMNDKGYKVFAWDMATKGGQFDMQ